MKKFGARNFFLLFTLGTCLIFSNPLSSEEEFRAKLLNNAGLFSDRMLTIKIKIEDYTTVEEVRELQKIYAEKGGLTFMNTLKKVDKGVVNFLSSRGLNLRIIAASVQKNDSGRKILLVMERRSWDTETVIRIDSDYLYMVIELDVDMEGRGTGKLYKGANIRMGGEQLIELIDSLPPMPIHNVRQTK
ncbi:MAG: hypothetical protein MUO43_10130 [Desulfobacterales bacterium]|nr:hypothetical protein [Desulfobacterales bacterium]